MADDKPAPAKKEEKKPEKKPSGDGKSEKKPIKPYQMWKLYEVKGDKLVRKNKFSPKAGEGYFMANHKDRLTCGKTYYMEKKDSPETPSTDKAADKAPSDKAPEEAKK